MTLLRSELIEQRWKLPRAMGSANQRWSERRSLLLCLRDAQGRVGVGEAAPLPGYSPDDLAHCRAALLAVDFEFVLQADAPAAIAAVERQIPASLPAARWAAQTAALDLIAQRHAQPLWQLLRPLFGRTGPAPPALAVAALLDQSESEEVLRAARAGVAAGVTTFKLKLGGRDRFSSELALVGALRGALGPRVALRLDANRSWSPGEARAHLEALAVHRPELVEEPVAGGALHDLGETPLPLALDESLQAEPDRPTLERWLGHPQLRVLVLKPMALGLGACLRLAAAAARRGLDVVLSHLFDGPVGFAAAASTAFAASPGRYAHGLVPHAGLGAWSHAPALIGGALARCDAAGLGFPALPRPRDA